MPKLSFKIAYPIIIAGLFIIVAFIALNYETLNINFYIILGLLIVYIFLFGFATGQNFAVPIKKLLQRADGLSKGDLKSRFYSESKDEIGELARVFNKIAEEFEESKNETQTLERSVDMKVKARTGALEETIEALEQKIKNRTMELERLALSVEKFQQDAKNRDTETAGLRGELVELREQLEKKVERKRKPKSVETAPTENLGEPREDAGTT